MSSGIRVTSEELHIHHVQRFPVSGGTLERLTTESVSQGFPLCQSHACRPYPFNSMQRRVDMIQFVFKIVFVERGQEALWRGWVSLGESNRHTHWASDGRSIGRCELIEAHDIEEAVQIAQRRYPDCTVMRESSERICSA